jgi:O-antigen/teichoic acid export membrane protein
VSKGPVGPAVARGFSTLLMGRAAVMVLQFVTLAVWASYLDPDGLGLLTFGLAVAALFRLLPNFGLVPVLTREVAQRPGEEAALVPNVIYIRALLGLVAYALLALTVLVVDFGADNARAALVAGVVLLVVFDVFRSSLEVRLRLGWISIADTIEAALNLAGALVLADAGAGVESFLWLHVALKALNAAIVTVVASRMADFSWPVRTSLWRPLIGAALPLGVAGVFTALYYRLDVVLLAWLKPAADVGQYGVAYRFLDAFGVLPAIAMTVLAPVFSRSFVEGGDVLRRRFRHSAGLLSVPAVYLAVVGGATAWRVLPELPGFAEFEGGGVALSIMCPAAGLILLGTVLQGTLISGHLQGVLLRVSAIGLGVNIALNLILIPLFSYVGAAAATTATEALLIGLSQREARRRLDLSWDRRQLLGLALATGVACALLGLGFLLDPFIQLALATAGFGAAVVVLGVLSPVELRRLMRQAVDERPSPDPGAQAPRGG